MLVWLISSNQHYFGDKTIVVVRPISSNQHYFRAKTVVMVLPISSNHHYDRGKRQKKLWLIPTGSATVSLFAPPSPKKRLKNIPVFLFQDPALDRVGVEGPAQVRDHGSRSQSASLRVMGPEDHPPNPGMD